jgi:hypothetical protein
MTAVSQPERSATPTPSSATSTVPSGALDEIADEVENYKPQPFGIHQAHDLDQAVVCPALRTFGPRIDHRDVEIAEDARQHDDACGEQRE